MKQTDLGLNLASKCKRKSEFFAQMKRLVPSADLVNLIALYYPEGKNGRPPFALETMPGVHFMQQWKTPSSAPLHREFAQLDAHNRLPDESTVLRLRHRLKKQKLADQMPVSATLAVVASSVVLHGIAVTPLMARYKGKRQNAKIVALHLPHYVHDELRRFTFGLCFAPLFYCFFDTAADPFWIKSARAGAAICGAALDIFVGFYVRRSGYCF